MDTPRHDIFGNKILDVEREEGGDEESRKSPWDPHRIRVTTKPWSIRQAIDDIVDKTIDLAPDFQRPSVWNATKRSRLIESILLGIPLPALYFSADQQGRMQVVDGVQRLSAIHDFASGKLALSELEYLKLDGLYFAQLDAVSRRRFHQSQLFVNVIEPETPPEVKFNIFKRINTGGEPLTSQEIRHALSSPRSREMLKRMTGTEAFHTATANAFREDQRMDARELALRFVALRLDEDLTKYAQAGSVDDYLIECTRALDDAGIHSDEALVSLEQSFEQAMTTAAEIFGDHAFRKWPESYERRSPLNRSLFDSWAVALAECEASEIRPRIPHIVAAIRREFTHNEVYLASVSNSTSHIAKVRTRLGVARSILSGGAP